MDPITRKNFKEQKSRRNDKTNLTIIANGINTVNKIPTNDLINEAHKRIMKTWQNQCTAVGLITSRQQIEKN